jgi:hypothetical protein
MKLNGKIQNDNNIEQIVLCFHSMATREQLVCRVRYPRHVSRDGLVRPYIPHEAMGLYILNVRHHFFLFTSISFFLFSAT